VGGERCRLLVTTRDATLARGLGAHLYDLDVMTEAQALALFEARLGSLDSSRDQAAALARELGYLPLALELAAAQVEGGVTWAELLDTFRHELADLAALDLDEAAFRNESLRLSFRLSLERLSDKDLDAFVWLGVLPEDVLLNPAMAATLWDEAEREARKRLRRLRNKALLKEIDKDRYTLHDLLHDEARLRLAEQMPLLQAHARLLDRYRRTVTYDCWDRLADDGYIHAHLTWHMEQGGQPEAIHALLRLETPEGRNAWYKALDRLRQTAGYLNDVRRAWRLTEEEFAIRNSQPAIGLQCRYALITASLNSLAQNLPPVLLVALVKEKMWTPVQGLAYACQIPGLEQRVDALVRVAPHLTERLKGKALREALAAAREIEGEWSRAKTLAGLAPHLPELLKGEALREALAVAREIEGGWQRAGALAGLVSRMAELGCPEEALAVAREIEDEYRRAKALTGLAPHLPEPLLRETLAVAREIESGWQRAEALAGLVSRMAELGCPEEALAVAREIENRKWRAEALTGLAPHLPEPLKGETLQEALAAVREIEDEWRRVEALTGLVPPLAELGYPEEALAAAREIESGWQRAKALTGLVPPLAELGYPEGALAVAREIESGYWRAGALAGLAPHLPELLKGEALREALAAAREIESEERRAKALAGLAPHLPELLKGEALREALAAAREIEVEWWRAEALTGLVSRMAELGYPEEALTVAQKIGIGFWRAKALARLVSLLTELGYLEEALTAARYVGDREPQIVARIGLLHQLPPQKQKQLWPGVVAAIRQITDYKLRGYVIVRMAPAHFPPSEVEEASGGYNTFTERRGDEIAMKAIFKIMDSDKWDKDTVLSISRAEDDTQRAEAWTESWVLWKQLIEVDKAGAHQIWAQVLKSLVVRPRPRFLWDVGALAPVIAALGGEEAIAETFRAIQDVGRWWP